MNDDGKISLLDLARVQELADELDPKVLKGDANGDGKVNARDARLIDRYILEFVDESQIDVNAADMNDNGKITMSDKFMLDQMIAEQESKFQTLQGDSNGDGVVDERDHQNIKDYLSHKDSSEDFITKNSDVNGDGVVDKKDLQGVRNILDGRKIDWNESKRLLGDVNGDGKIDVINDATTIINYLNGEIQKKDFYWDNADVNHDGKIDDEDANRIMKYVNGEIPSVDYEPHTTPSILGDVNGDGKVDVVNDEVLLSMYLKGEDIGNQTIHLNVADVNEDGAINEDDVQAIDNIFHGRPIDWKPDPVPPPNPINYPQEREIAGYAIWTYTDENLTIHQGNDVVTVGQRVLVLDETENVVHIQYTNVKGELLDRYIPAKPPAYQSWTAQALTYKEALCDDGVQYDKEAVFQNETFTVINEAENHYLVEYSTPKGNKIRWITKTDVIPYEPSTVLPVTPVQTSAAGIEMIKGFEADDINKYLTAYILPGEDEYTIGYGHKSSDIKKGMTITLSQAEEYLRQDLREAEDYVKTYCSHLNLNQNQFDALVSFTFNCGVKNLQKLLHGESGNENRPLEELPEHMPYYRLDATKKVSRGLERRRAAEIELFNTPVNSVTPTPNPIVEIDPPFTQGRAIRKTQAWSNPELTIPYSSQYEGLDANERITVKKASSDGRAYLVEYNSIYGGTKTRWVSAADIVKVEPLVIPDVPQKLQDLINYWTAKGKWTDHDYLSTVKECKEFASYIFNQLYDVGYIGGGSTTYIDGKKSKGINYNNFRINLNYPKKVRLLSSSMPEDVKATANTIKQYALTAESAREIFKDAQSGDFVQMRREGGGAHSAILTRKNEQGVWFLEANYDGNNSIAENFYTYEELANGKRNSKGTMSWDNIAMSIYRAK